MTHSRRRSHTISSALLPDRHRHVLHVGAVLSLMTPTLFGCGGGGSATTAPPEDTRPTPLLDFSAIAGAWTGSGVEGSGIEFFIDATIESSAKRGDEAGRVVYRLDAGGEPVCENKWLAADSEDPVFVFDEVAGGVGTCPPGTVTLERSGPDELYYEYTPSNGDNQRAAGGTLSRE